VDARADETGPPGGYAAVDVGYPEPGRARAAVVVAQAPDFGGELAEHVAWVTGVGPYSPAEFYRREL
jgi:deoxyinosine 3'endonuclease (endonuclease V)